LSEQVSAPSPGTTGRTRQRLLILFSCLALLAVIATVAVVLLGREKPVAASYPDVPPTGSPAPATCPSQLALFEKPVVVTRKGNLIPPGATEALLCSYSLRAPHPLPLSATHTLTTNVDDLIGYLNGLPSSPPQPNGCLLLRTTDHVIVFGYPNRQPAVVYDRDCGWEQGGTIRYDGDIKKITGYWGVPWNQ
jgi:hypothetical protein